MRTWVLAAALQVIALAVIVHRLFQRDNFSTSAGAVTGGCGLMPVPEYVITSRKVVMPDGVAPAAGTELSPVYGSVALGVAALEWPHSSLHFLQ